MIVIYPRDIYNNVIEGINSLLFVGELYDGTNLVTGIYHIVYLLGTSTYNAIKKRYELLLKPILAVQSILTITQNGHNIYESPRTVTVVPGPCNFYTLNWYIDSLSHSDFLVWNGDGVTPCYIDNDCSLKITLRD